MDYKILEQHQKSCQDGFAFYPYPTTENIEEQISAIRQPIGILGGKLSIFCSDLLIRGLHRWFKMGEPMGAKQDFYSAARASILSNKSYGDPTYSFDNVLFILLSDSEELIAWLSQDVGRLYRKDSPRKTWRNVVNEPEYHKFNFFLALQKKWELLERRSAYALDQGCTSKFAVVHTHYPFYLALARGDVSGMRNAVLEIISPKRLHKQNQSISPLSRFYLSAWGTIFAKLAMRNGYDLEIDSPWIPRECLPVEPPINYETPYDFLNVDIFTPYEGWAAPFSPRPIGEKWFDIEAGSDPTVIA